MNFSELKGSDTMKKALSLSLALLMFLSALVSCSEQPAEKNDSSVSTDTNISSDAAESGSVNERLLIPDNLPNVKFDGKSYKIYSREGYDYVSVEDITGESVNDAVYNRNITIEDRFDVSIENITHNPDEDITKVYDDALDKGPQKVLEQAIAEGSRIIFTTSAKLLSASLAVAVEHPEVIILNCSLNKISEMI